MNALVLFASIGIDPQLCGRLCLMLAHSVWQFGLLALVATLVTRFHKRENPELSYAVYVTALLVGLAALPITYSLVEIDHQVVEVSQYAATELPAVMPIVQRHVEQTAQSTPPIEVERDGSQASTEPVAIFNESPAETFLLRFAPWLVGCYTVGVIVMLLRLGQGIWKSYKLARAAKPVDDGSLYQAFQRIARVWSLRVIPVLAQAQEIIVPQVVGLLRPTILLPTSALSGLSPDELEMILAHELAHVRRHDMWVNLLQRLTESILFFNPALWYLSRRVSTYREYCCDEQTCRIKQDEAAVIRLLYAQALLHVVELSGKGTRSAEIAALAATGTGPSELRRRVARLFGEPLREPIGLSRNAILSVIAGLVLVIAGPAAWQNAAESKPETAAVLDEKASETKVEVVAIGTHDEGPQKWWDSEGNPIDNLPFEWEDDHRELPAGSKWRRVVIRVDGLPAEHDHKDVTWEIVGSPDFWGVSVEAKSKSDKAKYFARYFVWDGESDTFELRVGLTRGEWKTVARRMAMTSKPQANSIIFSDSRMTDQGLNVIVSHDVADQAYRIVAIDREQKQHRSASGGGNSVGRLVQSEGTFPGLKQEDLDHFEFQTRDYDWTEIKGLPAEPGKVANVKPIMQRETAAVLEEKPSSTKVEVVAIGTHDEQPQQWWNAEGELLKSVPFTWKKEAGRVTTEEDSLWRRVVIRIDAPIANSPKDRVWQIVGARGFSGGTIEFTGAFEPGTYLTRYFGLPEGVDSFGLRVGIATGAWKTLVKSGGMESHGLSGKSVVFSEPMSTHQGVDVIVSHNIRDQAYQIVAVDKSGQIHESVRSGGTSTGDIAQTRGTFPKLSLEELDHFEFQTRDYEWTKIKDLPVEPGPTNRINSSSSSLKPATDADRVVAAARDKTFGLRNEPRILFEQTYRQAEIETMQGVEERSLAALWEARSKTVGDAQLDRVRHSVTLAWDGKQLLIKTDEPPRPGDTFIQSRFWDGKEGWLGELANDKRHVYRYKELGKLTEHVMPFSFPHWVAAGGRLPWNGPEVVLSEEEIAPANTRYRRIRAETIDELTCDVYEGPERQETIWIDQTHGLVKAVSKHYVFDSTDAENWKAICSAAGREFADHEEFMEWHETLDPVEQLRFSARWLKVTWPRATPGNLAVFSNYREIAPGVHWPMKVERIHVRSEDRDGKKVPYFSRAEIAVSEVETDFAIRQLAADALPTAGVEVTDRRGEVPVDYVWSTEVTEQEIAGIQEKQLSERRAKEEEERQTNEAPIESVTAAIKILIDGPTTDPTKIWARAIKYLVDHKQEALPAVIAKLDSEQNDHPISKLAFTLRAMNDPCAVPALIRALPRTLQPSRSDYGLILDDPKLCRFMQQHDLIGKSRPGSNMFDYGRAFREVAGALNRLTGQNLGEMELNWVHLTETEPQRVQQRKLFHEVANRWAQWWEDNWKNFTNDSKFSAVNLETIEDRSAQFFGRREPPSGAGVELEEGHQQWIVQSVNESPEQCFVDLDTGREGGWPKSLPGFEKIGLDSPELLEWAREEGFDVVGVTNIPDGESKPLFCLKLLDTRAWRISETEHRGLAEAMIGRKPYPLNKPVTIMIPRRELPRPLDPDYSGDAFLFVTREGTAGVLRMTAQVTEAKDITGYASSTDTRFSSVGFYRGARIDFAAMKEPTP